MTLNDIITKSQDIRPSQFSKDDITRWINEIENRVYDEVIGMSGGQSSFKPYNYATDSEKTLAVPDQFEGVYLSYIWAKQDYANAEIARYNMDAQMADAEFKSFASWYRRRYRPRLGWTTKFNPGPTPAPGPDPVPIPKADYYTKAEVGALFNDHNANEEAHPSLVEAKHTHTNKSILDAITASVIAAWNAAASWITTNGAGVLSHISDTSKHVTSSQKSQWNSKQDAINDLSTIRSGAAAGATAVQPGSLATVATSGSYNDLSNKPSVPSKTSDLTNDGDGTNPFLTQHQDISGLQAKTDNSLYNLDEQGRVVQSILAVDTKVGNKQDTSNLVTAFQTTVDDTHYPSEKLVKDSLDGKVGFTDWATVNTGGVVKRTDVYAFSVNSLGQVFAAPRTFAEYQSIERYAFIGKDTLENVLTAYHSKRTPKTTLDAVATVDTCYYLGTQTTVSIVLPSSAVAGDSITCVFYSGATATTLSISGSYLGTLPTPTTNQRVELSLLYDGTNWCLLSNVMAVA